MDDRERKKWAKAIAEKETEILGLQQLTGTNRTQLSKITSDYCEVLGQLETLQQENRLLVGKVEQCEKRCQVKIERAKERVAAAERTRDDNRHAVEELTHRVALANNLALLPHTNIYLPEPLAPPSGAKYLTSTTLDAQDEAYLTTVLSTLTGDLERLREEKHFMERNYDYKIAHLQAQVAHRDAIVHSHIFASKQHHIPSPPPYDPRHITRDYSPLKQLSPTDALQTLHAFGADNAKLEEEIRQLGRRLEEAREQSRQQHAVPLNEPDGDTLDLELIDTRKSLKVAETELARLRERVVSATSEDARPPIQLSEPTTKQRVLRRKARRKNELHHLAKQIDAVEGDLKELKTEEVHLSHLDPNIESGEAGEHLEGILLLEEECLRLQTSQQHLREELLFVKEKLRECEAKHNVRNQLPAEIPLPSSPPEGRL